MTYWNGVNYFMYTSSLLELLLYIAEKEWKKQKRQNLTSIQYLTIMYKYQILLYINKETKKKKKIQKPIKAQSCVLSTKCMPHVSSIHSEKEKKKLIRNHRLCLCLSECLSSSLPHTNMLSGYVYIEIKNSICRYRIDPSNSLKNTP